MISSFRYIVNSSVKSQNIHFTKFVSDISPGHHSESNLHTPVGHCRWGSPILPSALWSHPTHPRLRCNWWKFFFHPGAAAPRSRCPCWICRFFHRTSYSCPFYLTAPLQLWPSWYGLSFDKVSDTRPSGKSLNFHFRRKQKIRTLLLLRKGSDFHCLVRIRGLEPPPSCPD